MKICLDAGHFGRYNQSPADSQYYESEIVWKLHELQKKYLEEYGIEVILTRSNQKMDLNLYDRGAASNGCDLFISDHTNAVSSSVNNGVDYPVAYCAINGSADGIGMALAQCVEVVMGTKQPARIEHRRGKNGDYYGVLRGSSAVGTPGLILENSFHTNSTVTRWMLDDANLDRLAKAQADTIAMYYNISEAVKKSGWSEEEGVWMFYLGDTGEPVRNDWYKDGDDWYWFDGSGKMITDTWYKYDGEWYYLGHDGAMVKGLQDSSGKWYYLDKEGKMATESVIFSPDENGALKYSGLANNP